MKCAACGGKLKFTNGLYVCLNCGSTQQDLGLYENIDVYICYVENDGVGRRTKDSVISQNLYNKMSEANISTFYQRISVARLIGLEFEKACEEAFNRAKIVILVATTKTNFEILLDTYKNKIENKTVIPIYSEINAYDLPKEISSLQAINYDTIGAISDIVKNILNILGRGDEIDTTLQFDKIAKERNKIIFSVTGILLTIIIAISSYAIFCTPYVLDSKKYDYALKLTDEGNYIEAIDVYSSIKEYKNSADLLKQIYSRYNGYYTSGDITLSLYITFADNIKAELEIERKIGSKIIKADTFSELKNNEVEFRFKDNQKNQGTGSIELLNDHIVLKTTTNFDNNLSIGNVDIVFEVNNKSDAPIPKGIEKKDLINWIRNQVTEKELREKGYELELLEKTNDGFEMITEVYYRYKIANTDIVVEFKKEIGNENAEVPIFDLWAPASLIDPQKVNSAMLPYKEDNIIFWPGESMYWGLRDAELADGDYILEDTSITISLSDIHKDALIAEKNVANISRDEHPRVIGMNDRHFLVETREGEGILVFYKTDRNNFKSAVFHREENALKYYNWEEFPEIFGGFQTIYNYKKSMSQNESSDLYKVRTSAYDAASQIGAYKILDSAKKEADKHKSEGYKVYNDSGELIYEP